MIEVVLATGLFAFVALAAFEVVRQLGFSVNVLAERAAAAAQLSSAAAALRSDALSATAVWKPAATCGDALEFMQRDASGTAFLIYALRAASLMRAAAAGPMNPCDATLHWQTVVPAVAAFTVTPVAAGALPAHVDRGSGNADGGVLRPAGITSIAVDAHVLDADGSHILTGNGVVEVTLDADPLLTVVDLVAGNRPSAYTQILAYTCNGRCEAAGTFPEARNAAYSDCAVGYDFGNTPAYYAAGTFGSVDAGSGKRRIVVTSYAVSGAYVFAFAGPSPATAERAWPLAAWPPAGSALAGTLADPYPVDYANNAVRTRGVAQLAADLGEPTAFAAELTACADMHADPTFHD